MFKNKNKADVIFIVIIFISLFIPMFHINKALHTLRENRLLANYKYFISDSSKINYNYGLDFERYILDRCFARTQMISLYSFIRLTLSYRNNFGFIDKSSGFMYLYNEYKLSSMSDAKKGFKEIYKLNDFCKNHNMKLYVLIIPQKSVIYENKKANIINQDAINRKFISYLNKVNNEGILKVAYPYEEMLEAKKDNYMFFKTDHHWTDDGAFVGYNALMKLIKEDYPNVKVVKSSDFDYFRNNLIRREFQRKFEYGRTYEMLGLPYTLAKHYHDTPYRYYRHKNEKLLKKKFVDGRKKYYKNFSYPNGSDLRVLLIGTSNNENMTEILPYSFKNLKYIRTNGVKDIEDSDKYKFMKYYEKRILEYKPDILILSVTYGNLYGLVDMFNKE